MNEFTKEELENILTCVNAVSYNNKESAETLKSSKEKLEYMIASFKVIRPLHEQFADEENLSRG